MLETETTLCVRDIDHTVLETETTLCVRDIDHTVC